MNFFSTFVFLLFFQVTIGLSNPGPTIIEDAAASFREWFHSPHMNISFVPPDLGKDLAHKAKEYAEEMLHDAATQIPSVSEKINEFKDTLSRIVVNAEGMGTILQDVDLEEFQKRFELQLSSSWEALNQEFSEPLPDNQTERYQQQAIVISAALEMIEDSLVEVCQFWKIPEADVRTKFDDIKPHLNHGLLVIANLVNNHPVLFEILLITLVLEILPESFILQLIVRFFGFGLLGPVKGSLAASAQRLFFGAVVKEGSWFSVLQRLGMKIWV